MAQYNQVVKFFEGGPSGVAREGGTPCNTIVWCEIITLPIRGEDLVFSFCLNSNLTCTENRVILPGCRTVSNNGSGSGLAPAQNILAVQVWFGFI